MSHHVLSLFNTVEQAAEHIVGDLRGNLGYKSEQITVLSGAPYHPHALGLEDPPTRLPQVAFVMWFVGGLLGFGLAAGTMMAYPINVGGKPIPSIPPSLIITYELAMLTGIVSTVLRTIYEWRLPSFRAQVYDSRVARGAIGVVVDVPTEDAGSRVLDAVKARTGLIDTRFIREGQEAEA